MESDQLSELKSLVEADPSDPRYVDYARELLTQGDSREAMVTCLRGLCGDPSSLKGRLTLAESFFIQGFVPFAVRELEELARLAPENETITKLRMKLDPRFAPDNQSLSATPPAAEEVAEEDFSIEDLESL